MSHVTHTITNLIAWLAVRAGARIDPVRNRHAPLLIAMPAAALLGQSVRPNRAGELVPGHDETREPEGSRSLVADWALWTAVALIVLILAAGYVRRRWRSAAARSLALSRDHLRK